MGRIIDKIVLTALGTSIYYLFFLNVSQNIPFSCALAFVSTLFTHRVLRHRPRRFKCTRAHAENTLSHIACLNEAEALEKLNFLIRHKYPDENFILISIIKHPESALSINDIFSVWKKHINTERLVIAATCNADVRTTAYCGELLAPRIALLDRRRLINIIRENPPDSDSPPRRKFSQLLRKFFTRIVFCHVSLKNALFALTLLGIYLLLGNPLYLFLSLAMLFLFGVSFFNNRDKSKLFSHESL